MNAAANDSVVGRYDPSPEQCNGCRFWLADPQSPNWDDESPSLGHCRRYPPKISEHMAAISIGTPDFGQQYDPEDLADTTSVNRACLLPVTFCTDWCGEYRTAPEGG